MGRRRYTNFGGRIGSEDEENRLLDRVYDLTCQGYTRDQIASFIGREKTAVTRYWKKLIEQGKLEKTSSGRIKKSQIQKEKQHYDELLKSEWLDGKNPEVKTWIDKMLKGGKKQNGVVAWKSKVSAFYVVCKTLNVSPSSFLISPEETEKLLEQFRELFLAGKAQYSRMGAKHNLKSGQDTSISAYVSAVSNFCFRNNKPLPKNADGILSRKKENYGVYANVQLSDSEVDKVLDFMKDHSREYNFEALTAIGHEMIPRPDTLHTMKNNITLKQEAIEDHICHYAEALDVYEKKTHQKFDKLIFNPRCMNLVQDLKPNHTFVDYSSLSDVKTKFTQLLREAYASIDRISSESVTNPNVYKKVIDGDRYYLANKAAHALRHSGCHMWLRRCNYNVVYVMSLGWDDPNMITQVYGKLTNAQRLHAGRCDYCRPPKVHIKDSNRMFCSWGHALIYYSNGNKSESQLKQAESVML